MKNVLIVAYAHFPGTTRLFSQIRVLRQSGHTVTLVCCRRKGEPASEVSPGLRVIRLPVGKSRRSLLTYALEWSLFGLLAITRSGWIALRRHFDVVQVFNQPDYLILCGTVPRLYGARTILDYRDPMPETYMSKFGARRRHPVVMALRGIEWTCLRLADHVLAVNEDYRVRLHAKGVDPRKITVWMNSPDPALFQFRPPVAPRDGTFTAVYHGTLARRLGVECALRAAALAQDTIRGFRLLILGEGELEGALREEVKRQGLEDCVQMLGAVPFEHLPSLLQQADVGLVPMLSDTYTETLVPTKLLEYAAVGVPVVASNTAAIRRHFKEDEVRFFPAGDSAALADRLTEMWRSPHTLPELARRARRRYEALVDRDSMVKSYLQVIENSGEPPNGAEHIPAG